LQYFAVVTNIQIKEQCTQKSFTRSNVTDMRTFNTCCCITANTGCFNEVITCAHDVAWQLSVLQIQYVYCLQR